MTTDRWTIYTGNCVEILHTIGPVDHCITDPPYSERTHMNAKTSRRSTLPDVADFDCRTKRRLDFGFEHLSSQTRRALASWIAEHVYRWSIIFSDQEQSWLWRLSLQARGVNYRRTGCWDRIGGAPQFNGMEPAAGHEDIIISHRAGTRRWNGGGRRAVYSYPVVANRLGQRGSRLHPTQKPLALMVAILEDFTDPDDTVIDPFCGSGTTGEAALTLGRRFIGIEQNPEWAELARDRLRACESDSTLQARRSKQEALFGK